MYRLVVSDYRHPWKPTTPEASYVRFRPLGNGEEDEGSVGEWAVGILTHSV